MCCRLDRSHKGVRHADRFNQDCVSKVLMPVVLHSFFVSKSTPFPIDELKRMEKSSTDEQRKDEVGTGTKSFEKTSDS